MYRLVQRRGIIGLFCLLFVASSVVPGWAQKDNRFEVSKNLDIFNSLLKEVEMFYVDSVDVDKTVQRGIEAMLAGLDPYTEYYPEQKTEELSLMTTGEYGGIGSLIRQRNNEGGVMIAEPTEGMPADLAGLKPGDLILAIDTIDVSKATNSRVSELLKGVPNTKMVLTIQRPGEKKPRKFEITRKQITTPQVTYYGVKNDSIGYIYLKAFTIKSAQEVKEAFLDLKKNHNIKSLVLDLRGNGGGDGARPEAENPAGRKLCAVGPRGAVRSEAPRYGGDGDGRHEGLPRGDSQRGVPPNPLRRLRGRGDSFGIRHGRTHLAGLFAGRQRVPLPGLDARHGTRRQRPVRPAPGRRTRRAEHRGPGFLVVVRLYPDTGRGARRRGRRVRHRRPYRPFGHPGLQSSGTMKCRLKYRQCIAARNAVSTVFRRVCKSAPPLTPRPGREVERRKRQRVATNPFTNYQTP